MAAILSNTFIYGGVCDDLSYTCYNNGGTNRYYYRKWVNYELFPDTVQVGDFVFICMSAPFDGWEAVNLDPIVSADHTIVFEYWNGTSWAALSGLVDGTNGFRQNGQITWDMPTDWETWRYDTNEASKVGAYAQFLVRCRITAVSGWTEGGYLSGYQKARQKYIEINDGGAHTPESLYNDDQTNGWGVITKKGDYTYDISCGVYFGNSTFTFNRAKIKIGEAGSPNYVPFKVWGCTMLCNDSSTHMSTNYGSALIVYSKGREGTITFYPHVNSKFRNLYIAQPYDTHYTRFATYTYGGDGSTQAQWYNVLFGSKMYVGGSHRFVRMNFQDISYMLSAGDTIYDDCAFITSFNKDPGYAPVLTRPILDGGNTSLSDWIHYYYPDSVNRQHHIEVISGKWTKGNKWKCYCDDAYPTSTNRSHIMVYSNYLNIKIQDLSGNAVMGAQLSIIDKHGNGALWEDLNVHATQNFSDVNDTTLIVDDASDLHVGDVILWWGEVLYIQAISGNTLTVIRGCEESARVFNLADLYVPLRRRVSTMAIDGVKTELYIQERTYYKYTLDGGITSTGNVYRDYAPLTIGVFKKGYKPFRAVVPLVDADEAINRSGEVFLDITLRPIEIIADSEVIV